jgi:Probable Zinc-ribbon domain
VYFFSKGSNFFLEQKLSLLLEMPKRKAAVLPKRPKLWSMGPRCFLSPVLDDEPPSITYQKIKKEFGEDIKMVFLDNWTSFVALFLIRVQEYLKTSNYMILDSRDIDPHLTPTEKDEIQGKKFRWEEKQVFHLGSKVCEECFRVGKLNPISCIEHQECEHKTYEDECIACMSHTLASCWKEHIDCFHKTKNEGLMPKDITRGSSIKVWFTCNLCEHEFCAVASDIVRGRWCPYCHKRKCPDADCKICLKKTFAAEPMSAFWHATKNGDIKPKDVSKGFHGKFWFTCGDCHHDFEAALKHLTYMKSGCPYCARNGQLCSDDNCQMCLDNSFASHKNSKFWSETKNGDITPRQVALNSHRKYWFICEGCNHDMELTVSDMSRETGVTNGCGYCYGKALCTDLECDFCLNRSFASNKEKSQFWNPTKNGNLLPRFISLHSGKICWFTCGDCKHDFDARMYDIARNQWCPYCSHHRRCGKPSCSTCELQCIVCQERKARVMTISGYNCCKPCLADIVSRDPKQTPDIQKRAKISLEMYTLAELQRIPHEKGFFLNMEPTAWDCQVLPDMGFKPDLIWCFGENGLFDISGKCNLLANEIHYVLILEVIECSRRAHSGHRSIPDEDREDQIRDKFNSNGVAVGLVYVTMAHTKHLDAHTEDVFFERDGEEYRVIKERFNTWQKRIVEVQDALTQLYSGKCNKTIKIGH